MSFALIMKIVKASGSNTNQEKIKVIAKLVLKKNSKNRMES